MSEQATATEETSTQRREAELQALYWITQAANFTMPVDDVLELIYTQIQRVVPASNFYIALAHPENKTLSFVFYVENSERQYPHDEWGFDEGLTGAVVSKGVTIRTRDYLTECRARGIQPGGKAGRAWLGVPLIARDQIIGVMVASSYESAFHFSKQDEGFFVTVASYIASAIERRRLYERLETRARQMNTLNEIGNLLASSLDINNVLDLVVRNAALLLNAEAGSLLLLDEDSGDLIFRISSGPSGQQLVGQKVPAGKGIAGVCFSENRPIIVDDTHHDQRWYSNFDRRSDFITSSLLAVPLNARGRTIGVLEVINRKAPQSFGQEDVDLLLSFGAQSAIAIENARLFTMTDQALQARVEELTMLQHIDRQLNATLDYREVMKLTLDWAIRISGATIGLIAALHEEEDGTRGLQILAHHGYPEGAFDPYMEEKLWPLERGLIGQAVREARTIVTRDVTGEPNYATIAPGMRSMLSLPIQRENRVTGVLAVEATEPEQFSKEALESVIRLADHAAIAIDNARLFQQVQRANQAKTEFVSFVSHELKQPMTSMKGYTDLLMKGIGGELNPQQKMFLDVIRSNVQRMDRLVSDLLDMSRIESGRLRLEMASVQPQDVAHEAIQAFEQAFVEKHQALEVKIEPELPTIYGDRGRLIQVLTNLISNANKYTPEGGHVTVIVERLEFGGKDCVRWAVSDTGIGMTPEELQKLFTKYFRSDNPAVRNVKGTGLGLVITRSIIEMHAGQIMVESETGKGSTFSFVIPVEQKAETNQS